MSKDKSTYEELQAGSKEMKALLAQEDLIFRVTEEISEQMELAGMTKARLAEKMGRTRSFATQLLSGGRNLTLRTLADAATALDCTAEVRLGTNDSSIVAPTVESLLADLLEFPQSIDEPVEASWVPDPWTGAVVRGPWGDVDLDEESEAGKTA